MRKRNLIKPVHPSAILLKEFLKPMGISVSAGWLGLQKDYELDVAKIELAQKIKKEVHPCEFPKQRKTKYYLMGKYQKAYWPLREKQFILDPKR